MKKTVMEELICRQEGFSAFGRAALEQRQLELLNLQLSRGRAVSSFYREYPEVLDSLDDVKMLPFTVEDTLRRRFSQLCLLPASGLVRMRTSGTTGEAKRVAYSQYDCDRTLDFFIAGLGELIHPDNTVLLCFPGTDAMSLGGLLRSTVTELGARAVSADENMTFGGGLALLEREHPEVYIGPPVLLLSLLRLNGGKSSLCRALVSGDTCAGVVISELQGRLEDVRRHYGLRESGLGGAVECAAHAGLHIRENDILCEIIDKAGSSLPDGEWGELVISTIGLEAMPLLRYRTGDRARILTGACPCGSTVKRLEVSCRAAGARMEELENLLFALPGVVDFRASADELTLLTLTGGQEEKHAAEALCPGMRVTVRRAGPNDRPCYSGKRILL